MYKTIVCLRKKEGMSDEEFQDYWENRHAKLIEELHEDLNIVRYVQSHTLRNRVSETFSRSRGGNTMYDGVSEAWFESLDEMTSLAQNPKALKAVERLMRDEANFLDLKRCAAWISKEKTIV